MTVVRRSEEQLMHQPRKHPGLYRNNQRDHEAGGQTHNRARSDSAPKHLLFTVCHFIPPSTTDTLPLFFGQDI
jgi:hypothetical protein